MEEDSVAAAFDEICGTLDEDLDENAFVEVRTQEEVEAEREAATADITELSRSLGRTAETATLQRDSDVANAIDYMAQDHNLDDALSELADFKL